MLLQHNINLIIIELFNSRPISLRSIYILPSSYLSYAILNYIFSFYPQIFSLPAISMITILVRALLSHLPKALFNIILLSPMISLFSMTVLCHVLIVLHLIIAPLILRFILRMIPSRWVEKPYQTLLEEITSMVTVKDCSNAPFILFKEVIL